MTDVISFSPPLEPFRSDFCYGTYLWLCRDSDDCMLAVYSEDNYLLPTDYWDPGRRLYSISCDHYIDSLPPIANNMLVRGLARFGMGIWNPERAALEYIIVASRGISVAFSNPYTGRPELTIIPRRKLKLPNIDSKGRDLVSSAVADISIEKIGKDLVPSAVAELSIMDMAALTGVAEDDLLPDSSRNPNNRHIDARILARVMAARISETEEDSLQLPWSNVDYSQIVDQYGETINQWTSTPCRREVGPESERFLPAEFALEGGDDEWIGVKNVHAGRGQSLLRRAWDWLQGT